MYQTKVGSIIQGISLTLIFLAVLGAILDFCQLTTLPHEAERLLRVGLMWEDKSIKGVYAILVPGFLLIVAVGICGVCSPTGQYEKPFNNCCLGCFCFCTFSLGGIIGGTCYTSIAILATPLHTLEVVTLPGLKEWFKACDPSACCRIGGAEEACEPNSAMPLDKYYEPFLDCLLGADPEYTPKYGVRLESSGKHQCQWSLFYLTHCDDRWNKEFVDYTDTWLEDTLVRVNDTLAPDYKLASIEVLTPYLSEVFHEDISMEKEKMTMSDDRVVGEIGKIDWDEFSKSVEHVDWNAVKWREFKMEEMFKSNLTTCQINKPGLHDAYHNDKRITPLVRDSEMYFGFDVTWVTLFAITTCCGCTFACFQMCVLEKDQPQE